MDYNQIHKGMREAEFNEKCQAWVFYENVGLAIASGNLTDSWLVGITVLVFSFIIINVSSLKPYVLFLYGLLWASAAAWGTYHFLPAWWTASIGGGIGFLLSLMIHSSAITYEQA